MSEQWSGNGTPVRDHPAVLPTGFGIPGPDARPATSYRSASARRASCEIRWFVRGAIGDDLRPRGPSRRRTDVYHLASLGPESSLKRREGSGPLEWKVRIGPREACKIAGVPAFAERWVKHRLRDDAFDLTPPGDWIDVHKRLWRASGVEICRLELEGQRWWTVALPTERPDKPMRKVLTSWAPLLRDRGEATSYPIWLRTRWSDLVDHAGLASTIRDEAG